MRTLRLCFVAVVILCSARAEENHGAPPVAEKAKARKSVPIAGGWVLTAARHEKTKTEGARTLLLTATGEPVLNRASKIIGGAADITAKAEKIECDFVRKKLVLSGSPQFRQVNPRTKAAVKTITGEAGTLIEIPLRYGVDGGDLKVEGAHKVTPGDTGAPEEK